MKCRHFGQLKCLAFAFFFLTPVLSFAQQAVSPDFPAERGRVWNAEVVKENDPQFPGVPHLSWKDPVSKARDQGSLNFVDLTGIIDAPIRTLEVNGQAVERQADGSFLLQLGFSGNKKTMIITTYDEKNQRHSGKYTIQTAKVIPAEDQSSPFRFTFGLGVTSLQYTQTGYSGLNEQELTAKASISFITFRKRLTLSLGGFENIYTIHSSSKEYAIRFLGLNAKMGYLFSDPEAKWLFSMNGGLYLNTSLSNIGFAGMYGPQIYPDLVYRLKNGNAIFSYAKYSPVTGKKGTFLPGNHEIATGVHYSFPAFTDHRMSIGIDFSQFDIKIGEDASTTHTLSLSTGFTL